MMDSKLLYKFLSTPFKNKGRDFNGFDCLGLVKVFYKEVFNIEITDFAPSCYDIQGIIEGFARHIQEWDKIDVPEYGCLVAMNNYRSIPDAVNHVGIYLGNDEVLHIKPNTHPSVEKSTNPNFFRIRGYYVPQKTSKK